MNKSLEETIMYDGRLSVAVWVLITLWARWRISTVANASHLLAAAVTYTFHLEAGQPLGQALRREGLAIYSNTPSFETTSKGRDCSIYDRLLDHAPRIRSHDHGGSS